MDLTTQLMGERDEQNSQINFMSTARKLTDPMIEVG